MQQCPRVPLEQEKKQAADVMKRRRRLFPVSAVANFRSIQFYS